MRWSTPTAFPAFWSDGTWEPSRIARLAGCLLYTSTDGVDPETEEGAHNGFVFVKEGSGVTFNVPGGPDLKYLNVYTGEWASDITLELLVNGEVEYLSLIHI